jgi:predicted porin
MKKLLIASAAMAMVAGTAQAQSTVTVYGLIDTGYATSAIDHGAGVETKQRMVGGIDSSNGTGTLSGSRLGFRGTEDLGGGLKANFQLETAIKYSTGEAFTTTPNTTTSLSSNASMFGNARQAWVGLSGGFGEVRVGTVNSLAKDMTEAIDPNAGIAMVGIFQQSGLQATRPANVIQYNSPVMSGFSLAVQHVEGETTTNATTPNDNYARAIALRYRNAGLDVIASQESRRAASYAENGNRLVALSSGSVLTFGTTAATVIDKVNHEAYGASYTIGGVKLAALQTRLKMTDATAADNSEIESTMFGATYTVGQVKVMGSYSTGNIKAASAKTYDLEGYQLVVQYDLSKRTNVYGAVAQAEYDSPTANLDVKANQMAIGLRHSF